jgi:hypothetical protein
LNYSIWLKYLKSLEIVSGFISIQFRFKINIKDQVRDSVSGAEHFVAEYAIIATWGNVTFLGISQPNLELRPVIFYLSFKKELKKKFFELKKMNKKKEKFISSSYSNR